MFDAKGTLVEDTETFDPAGISYGQFQHLLFVSWLFSVAVVLSSEIFCGEVLLSLIKAFYNFII